MSKFDPVSTVAEFNRLNEGEIMEGYFDGFHDAPAPSAQHSRSYRHGWRNGQVDSGHRLPDEFQQALDRDFRRLACRH